MLTDDIKVLGIDLQKLTDDYEAQNLAALGGDLQLVASDLARVLADFAQQPPQLFADEEGNTRLQNLICMAIPFLNVFLAAKGFPPFPMPAFCSTTVNSQQQAKGT